MNPKDTCRVNSWRIMFSEWYSGTNGIYQRWPSFKQLKAFYDKRIIELEKLVQSTKDKLPEEIDKEIEDIVENAQSRNNVLKKKLELSNFENERIKTVASN